MKVCPTCGETDPAKFYPKRGKCKECHKNLMRPRCAAHYKKNKSYYAEKRDGQKAKAKRFVQEYKEQHPTCTDCGKDHPPWRLEFDHLRDKTTNIADAHNKGWGIARLKREIEKCELVCANCHRDRTHQRAVEESNLRA